VRYAGRICTKGRSVYEPVENLPSELSVESLTGHRNCTRPGDLRCVFLTGHWDMRSSDLSSTDLMRN
jgi:hypothetical protein